MSPSIPPSIQEPLHRVRGLCRSRRRILYARRAERHRRSHRSDHTGDRHVRLGKLNSARGPLWGRFVHGDARNRLWWHGCVSCETALLGVWDRVEATLSGACTTRCSVITLLIRLGGVVFGGRTSSAGDGFEAGLDVGGKGACHAG